MFSILQVQNERTDNAQSIIWFGREDNNRMNINYDKAKTEDIEHLYQLNKQLFDDYENVENDDHDRALKMIHKRIETSIDEYTVVFVDGRRRATTVSIETKIKNMRLMLCISFRNIRTKGSARR